MSIWRIIITYIILICGYIVKWLNVSIQQVKRLHASSRNRIICGLHLLQLHGNNYKRLQALHHLADRRLRLLIISTKID